MEFSWGLLLICVGAVGTLVSLICLAKSLQTLEATAHSDIEEIAMGYANNRNDNETESIKKSVLPAQTSVHLDTINIFQKQLHQNDETILNEDNSHIPQESAIYHSDDETVLDEDIVNALKNQSNQKVCEVRCHSVNELSSVPLFKFIYNSTNQAEEQNIYHEDDETVLDDDDANPAEEQRVYHDDDETVLIEDTMTEIELLK